MFTTSGVVVFKTVHCRPIRADISKFPPIAAPMQCHVMPDQDEVNDPPTGMMF
jgi:hypothetical protein